MIKIKHIITPSDEQMMFVIEGMRNAFNSWDKSDSKIEDGVFQLGEVDKALMEKLARLGSDERKFLRQMPVMMRITAPLYWWKEFDTYKVGTVSNSCSTMHTIADHEFQWEDFSVEHLRYERFGVVEDAQNKMRDDAITQFENTRHTLNAYRHQYLKAKEKGNDDLAKEYWRQMIQLLPSSFNQTRNVTLNYEVLCNIFKARRGHKLREWRDFCDVIKTLPYFSIIEASLGRHFAYHDHKLKAWEDLCDTVKTLPYFSGTEVPRENIKASNEETH